MALNAPQGNFRMPTPYDKELSSIARRERMAQIMQQQAFQPLQINSYNGIQAPISPLQGIAKALQMYAGMTAGDKADESRAEIGKRMQTDAAQQIASLDGTPAQPAIAPTPGTSFTPMGADFEDNPNLQVAPSGNVEMAGTPGRAAIPAMSLGDADKKKRLIEILTGGNPYSAPAAKFMLEDMQKSGTGPLAEYKLYAEQAKAAGQTPLSIDAYKTRQIQAGRAVNTINMPSSMAPMFVRDKVTKETKYIQPDNKGGVDLSRYEPVPTQSTFAQKLADAGIYPDNPRYQEYALALINKETLVQSSPGQVNTTLSQKPPSFVPNVPPGGTVNPDNVDTAGNLVVTPTPGAQDVTSGQESAKSYGTTSGNLGAGRDNELFNVASKAPELISKANQITDLISSGAITGTGAEYKLSLAKALNVTGKGNSEIIKNTELLVAQLSENVLNSIKASGLGAGQGFTDSDRKFLERAKGGTIDLNAGTLKEFARLTKLAAMYNVEKWNERLPNIPQGVAKTSGYTRIDLGNVYSSSDIAAELRRRGLTQ